MKTVDILTAAKALITEDAELMSGENRHGRTLLRVYRKANGVATLKRSEATCFCSIGAVLGALNLDAEVGGTGLLEEGEAGYPPTGPTASNGQRKAFLKALDYLAAAVLFVRYGNYSKHYNAKNQVYEFNDAAATTHADVLRAFDLAIKNAKRRHVFGSKTRQAVAQ